MKTNNKNRKNKLLALFLSALMVSSMATLAACKDSSTDSSSSSSSAPTAQEKEDALIKNGSFENFAFDAKGSSMKLIGTSVSNWTKNRGSDSSSTAPSSKAESGIVSTLDEDWKQLTTSSGVDVTKLTQDEAKAKWDTMTVKDKLLYQEKWEDDNDDKKIAEELSFYQSSAIDSEDLPTCENPGTATEDAEDSNVLMIHNEYPTYNEYNYVGTAQYYTSSSTVTLKAGTAATLSLWVKTADLKMASLDKDGADAINKGAYINIEQTVGSKKMPLFQVKNIDTDEWKQYTFYVESSSFADSTFTLTLGLGQGGNDDKLNHVNGYAFFDEISCNVVTDSEAPEELTPIDFFSDDDSDKIYDAKEVGDKFALNLSGEKFVSLDNQFFSGLKFAETEESNKHGVVHTSNLKADTDKCKTYNTLEEMKADVNGNPYLDKVYTDNFATSEFVNADDKVVLLLSTKGAAYTAASEKTFTLLHKDSPDNKQAPYTAKEYMAISFYVKTSDVKTFTGAGITLHDGAEKISLSNINTTSIETVDTDEKKDIYEGWQRCLFYVKNETKSDKTFTLTFNYGPTTIIGNTANSYYEGFAAFTKFEAHEMNESEFEIATSGTYASIVSLTGAEEEEVEGTGFDVVTPTTDIKNGYAALKNYTLLDDSAKEGVTSGLLNKKYAENYTEILNALAKKEGASWDEVFGNTTKQPLVIYNNDGEKAIEKYGYLGKKTTIAANTYKTVSLRVKIGGVAEAIVRLVDMDTDSKKDALSISRTTTYWYDAEGNVCSKDPTEHGFNDKKHVVFKLQSNGLYKLNNKWENYSTVDASLQNAYFANLANYEKDGDKLLVAKDGVTYDYKDSAPIHEGNNGVAFYGYNAEGNFAYTQADNKGAQVYDFAKIATEENAFARYDAKELGNMTAKLTSTNDGWATVSFYIHTGDVAKNYRLEVSVEKAAAGAYVAFDANDPATVDEAKYASLIEERQDGLEEDKDYFKGVFSFYDSAKYLRFNENKDVNEKGIVNPYASYDATSYTSGVAYLAYNKDNVVEVFADYALSEVTVEKDAEKAEDEEITPDHDHEGETNVWLLISSIAIAAVLLLAMVSIIVQKAVRSYRKKNGIAPKAKKEKKTK